MVKGGKGAVHKGVFDAGKRFVAERWHRPQDVEGVHERERQSARNIEAEVQHAGEQGCGVERAGAPGRLDTFAHPLRLHINAQAIFAQRVVARDDLA